MDLTQWFKGPKLTLLQLSTRKYASLANCSSDTDGTISPSFLLERTLQFNVFGCPLSTHKYYLSRKKLENKDFDEVFHSCGIWQMAYTSITLA